MPPLHRWRFLPTTPNVRPMLMDIVLPGCRDDIELADEAQRQRPELRMLFLPGYFGAERLRTQKDGKFIRFLQKPFRRVELLKKVVEALGKELAKQG